MDNATGFSKLIAMDIEDVKEIQAINIQEDKNVEDCRKSITMGVEFNGKKFELTEIEKKESMEKLDKILNNPQAVLKSATDMLGEYGIDINADYSDKLKNLDEKTLQQIHKNLSKINPAKIRYEMRMAILNLAKEVDDLIYSKTESEYGLGQPGSE